MTMKIAPFTSKPVAVHCATIVDFVSDHVSENTAIFQEAPPLGLVKGPYTYLKCHPRAFANLTSLVRIPPAVY